MAALGAIAYVLGAALVAAAAFMPLRRATGPRRPLIALAYAVALANVALGASIAALYLLGEPGVVGRWAALRAAHAWLNAFGFVGLVVAGTLVHFAPTVAGARIRARPTAVVAVAGLATGPGAVALGYVLTLDAVVVAGALATLVGGLGLAAHGLRAQRDAGGWTTDAAWHRFTSGSLLAAPAWLVVASAIATAGVVPLGADPAGWRLEAVVAPLVVGFVVQVLLGALAHLVPAIGPGGPERHAAARQTLGRDSTLRLGGWNVGTAALTAGLLGIAPELLLPAGGATLAASLAATLLLLGLCLRDGR
jgi:nitrite reductase (NO-forming)